MFRDSRGQSTPGPTCAQRPRIWLTSGINRDLNPGLDLSARVARVCPIRAPREGVATSTRCLGAPVWLGLRVRVAV